MYDAVPHVVLQSCLGNPLDNVLGIWGLHKEDGSLYTENIENLLLFVPFIPLLFWMREEKEHNKKKPLQAAALMHSVSVSFGFSLLIELCQLFLKIGTFQLTDLFFNTLGGLLGGLIYWGFDRSRKRAEEYVRRIGGWDTEVWEAPEGNWTALDGQAETAAAAAPNEAVPAGQPESRMTEEDEAQAASEATVPADSGENAALTSEQENAITTLIRERDRSCARQPRGGYHSPERRSRQFCHRFRHGNPEIPDQRAEKDPAEAEFFGEEDTKKIKALLLRANIPFILIP